MKKLLTFTLFFTLFFSTIIHSKVNTYFSPENNLEKIIINNIKMADLSIDIAIYTFSSKDIKDALLERIDNGVNVRILINNGKDKSIIKFVKPLINKGAIIQYVSKINHHKFMIIDNNKLINSSGNFSGSKRAKSYDENLVINDENIEMILAYQNEFNRLFFYSNKLIGKNVFQNNTSDLNKYLNSELWSDDFAIFTSKNFRPYKRGNYIKFKTDGPNDKGLGHLDSILVNAIDNAMESIKIATGHFRSKPLYEAVKRAVNRGIKVAIVLDGQEYISKSKQYKENKKIKECIKNQGTTTRCYSKGLHFGRLISLYGATVKFKYYAIRWHFPYAAQMHHKYMIIDNQIVYSGSYNWSFNAEFSTFENVAIYKSTKVINNFNQNFSKIFNYGEGKKGYERLIKTYNLATKSIPTVFAPISLTVKQIDSVKKLARSKCPSLYTGRIEARNCKF